MPKLPRDISQQQAMRAMLRLGGKRSRAEAKAAIVLQSCRMAEALRRHSMRYTVLVSEAEPDEGGFWAKVAEFPGCVTQGETIDESD